MNEEQLHKFRKEIDALIQKAKNTKGYLIRTEEAEVNVYGREMALVHTHLQEAKMWVGKCLEELGAPFPEELRDSSK